MGTHIKILLEGVNEWNAWREAHPEIRPVLRGADLRGQMLRGANFRETDLRDSNLRDVNFRRADLSLANLELSVLYRAFFSGANLRGANFRGARFFETVLADVDLSDAKNLDKSIHRGPSVLDHRTLARSGNLPLSFLQGCGLPDALIGSSNSSSIQRYFSCFISYSAVDEEFAEQLFRDLQANGVRCWFAPEDIKIGDKIRTTIDGGIRNRERLLLVLSKSSIASPWVEKEVETAFEEERRRGESVLFPIRLDDAALAAEEGWPADIRRNRHIGDFRNWQNAESYNAAVGRLLRDLQHLAVSSTQVDPEARGEAAHGSGVAPDGWRRR